MNVSHYLVALIAALTLLTVPRPLTAQTPASTPFSPCSPLLLPAVQAPSTSVVPIDGGFSITPGYLASLADAQAQYDFPLLLPTAIPDGYQVGKIDYVHTQPGTPELDLLSICYVASDGSYLHVMQGYPLPARGMVGTPYAYMPDDEKGTATVQGKDAYWQVGGVTAAGPLTDPSNSFVWQPGPLRLTWNTDISVPRPPGAFIQFAGGQPMSPPPVYIGYLLESDTLNLDELVAIGNSVQPYTTDAGP